MFVQVRSGPLQLLPFTRNCVRAIVSKNSSRCGEEDEELWEFASALLGEIVIGVLRGATVATKGIVQEAAEAKKTTVVIHFAEARMC